MSTVREYAGNINVAPMNVHSTRIYSPKCTILVGTTRTCTYPVQSTVYYISCGYFPDARRQLRPSAAFVFGS